MTDSTRKGLTRPALWVRIAGAHLPVERDGREFAEHLAEIAGLSPQGGRVLEQEYRRFLYLAVISREPRVPPGLVRVAWSYHAEHEGYRREFCHYVLGGPMLFTPSVTAPARAYAATVMAYAREFSAPPPPAIWPDPDAPASLPFWHGAAAGPDPLHA
jgi:hypothetical protein